MPWRSTNVGYEATFFDVTVSIFVTPTGNSLHVRTGDMSYGIELPSDDPYIKMIADTTAQIDNEHRFVDMMLRRAIDKLPL